MAEAMLKPSTSKDLSVTVNDLTICSICLDILKVPTYFSCLHTFCRSCVFSYINNSFGNKLPKTIPCPVCRAKIKVPDSVKSAEDWSEKLPVNHIIISLIDAQKMQKGKSQCGPCKKLDGEKESSAKFFCSECSEALCEACSKYHKAFKSFVDHELVEIGMVSDVHLKIGTHYTTCNEHMKKIEVYCKDHKKPCCLHCITLEHRKCNEVVGIDEAAKNLRDGDTYLNLMNSFGSLARHFNGCIEEQESLLWNGQQDHKSGIERIQNTRKKIEKELLKLEQKCLDQLSFKCGENISALNKTIQSFEEKKNLVLHCQNMLRAGLRSNSDIQLLIDYQNMKAQRDELENFLYENAKVKYTRIEVCVEESVLTMTQQLNCLGSIVADECTTESSLISLLECDICPGPYQKYGTALPRESKFSGVACHEGHILLVDRYKRKLYVFEDESSDVDFKSIKLKPPHNHASGPWDVTGTLAGRCIVTFPEMEVLADVDIEVCCVKRWIQVNNPQTGISFYNDTIISTSRSANGMDTVSIFGLKGNLIKEYKTCRPNYLCVDNIGRIIFSNRVDNKVICMTCNFEIVFTYSHENLDGIAGITTDVEGNIYVAGFVSNNVHQLTPSGKLQRILLHDHDDVVNPRGISFNEYGDILLVLNDSGKKINMFQFLM